MCICAAMTTTLLNIESTCNCHTFLKVGFMSTSWIFRSGYNLDLIRLSCLELEAVFTLYKGIPHFKFICVFSAVADSKDEHFF